MEKSLRDKVTDALKEAAGEDAQIELEEVAGGKVGGFVLSGSFAGHSASDRQDQIWKHLDDHLSTYERTRVVFIVTDTPDEHAAIKAGSG